MALNIIDLLYQQMIMANHDVESNGVSPDNGQDTPDREDFMNWNCINCGLPVEEGEEFNAQYQTRWRHRSRDGGFTKFVSCAYANRTKTGSPDLQYNYPTVVATPDVTPLRPDGKPLESLVRSERLPKRSTPTHLL